MTTDTPVTATTIDEVIEQLDAIIEWSKQNKSRMGYFATLYRKMTIAVKKGIANDLFNDGLRMERLDIIFANRYLSAFHAYINKQPCTNAWCAAFDASESDDLIVLQHLILGINTHINLDLCIAAAEACPAEKIFDLEEDFNKINDIIASLIPIVENDLCEIWSPLKILTAITYHTHQVVLNFSISIARKASWENAIALCVAKDEDKEDFIKTMDQTVVKIANRVKKPGLPVQLMFLPILKMENENVAEIIDLLLY